MIHKKCQCSKASTSSINSIPTLTLTFNLMNKKSTSSFKLCLELTPTLSKTNLIYTTFKSSIVDIRTEKWIPLPFFRKGRGQHVETNDKLRTYRDWLNILLRQFSQWLAFSLALYTTKCFARCSLIKHERSKPEQLRQVFAHQRDL